MSLPTSAQDVEQLPGFTTEAGHIPVRDRRNKNWHWKLNRLHDEFLYEQTVITFAAVIGPAACTTYDYLCRRADEETQTCFPSVPTVAFITGQSEVTVTDTLSLLSWYGIVQRVQRQADEGDPTSNLYILLPIERWSIEGGKSDIKDDLVEKQSNRLERMLKRTVPYALRKRYFPASKVSVEVVQNFNHPPKGAKKARQVVKILNHPGSDFEPPVPQNFNQGGSVSKPPLDQDSFVPDTDGIICTTEDRAPVSAVSSAIADAVVESKILSGAANQETSEATAQLPLLPAVATPNDRGEHAAELEARLVGAAADAGLECAPDIAARVIAASPLARISDEAVLDFIGKNHAQIGLGRPIGRSSAVGREMREDPRELRWRLWSWPGLRAEVEAGYARKNQPAKIDGAFVTKWLENTAPEAGWMEEQIGAVRAAMRAEALAEQESAAKSAWERLGGPERALLVEEAKQRADARGVGDWNEAQKRQAEEKRRLLLDAEFVAGLSSKAAAPTVEIAAALPAPAEQTEEALLPAELNRCALFIVRLHRQIESGEASVADLPRLAQGCIVSKAAKRHIVASVERLLEQKEAA